MLLIPPLSTPGIGRQYREALPQLTAELAGDQGVEMAVGYEHDYIVYRGMFDPRKPPEKNQWQFSYFGPVK